jgi:hypothetical protein
MAGFGISDVELSDSASYLIRILAVPENQPPFVNT